MQGKPIYRLRARLSTSSLATILLCAGPAGIFAQTPPSLPQRVPVATHTDPTQHEAQPKLEIDRDPVASPDADDSVEGGAGKTLTKEGSTNVYTLRQNVEEVLLSCAVVDAKGQIVENLKQRDFRVEEEGVPQTVTSFQHRDQPASIGILVDNSGSMIDKRTTVNIAALAMIKASNPRDTAFVVNFSDRAYLDQGFTSDVSALQKGLSRLDSKGPTAMYDAVDASANELARHARWPEQVLLIITDGKDDASRLSLQQTVERVQQLGGPVVYAIGLLYEADSKEEGQQAHDVLETLASKTGGIAYFPRSLDEVQGIAQMVAEDIRNQYVIGYALPNAAAGTGFRTVRVEAQANGYGRLIVRTRTGYYPRQVAAPGKPTRQAARTSVPPPAPASP